MHLFQEYDQDNDGVLVGVHANIHPLLLVSVFSALKVPGLIVHTCVHSCSVLR